MNNPYAELTKLAKSFSLSTKVYREAESQMSRSAAYFSSLNTALTKQIEIDRNLFNSTNAVLDQLLQVRISPEMQVLTRVNTHLNRMLERVSVKDSMLSKIFQDQQRLNVTIKELAINDSWKSAFARIDTTRMFSVSLLAQKKLAAFDRLSLGSLVGIDAGLSKALRINFGNFTRSYKSLLNAASTHESLLKHVSFISTYSPVEYYREVDFLETITVEDKETGDDDDLTSIKALSDSIPPVDALLADFDPTLPPLLQGARDSVVSDNPDRARHVTISVRELFSKVLHALAPDEEIREWSTDKRHFHNNRPTRRARFEYICRHINAYPLTCFLEDDVHASLSFIDSLNSGIHVVESRLTKIQLRAIVSRMESLLVFLLQLRNSD